MRRRTSRRSQRASRAAERQRSASKNEDRESVEIVPIEQDSKRRIMGNLWAVTVVALVLGLLLTAPLTALAQRAPKVWRIGFLGDGPRAERAAISLEPFRDGLRELGYIESQNVLIEERWSEGRAERLLGLATELVRLKVDVIVTHGVRGTKAAQNATRTIPIVMAVSPDPVGTGLVASLARPGGNTTGMTDQVAELGEKEIQIIREVVPRTRRVAILWNESNPVARVTFEQTRNAATKVGLGVVPVAVRSPIWSSGSRKTTGLSATRSRWRRPGGPTPSWSRSRRAWRSNSRSCPARRGRFFNGASFGAGVPHFPTEPLPVRRLRREEHVHRDLGHAEDR